MKARAAMASVLHPIAAVQLTPKNKQYQQLAGAYYVAHAGPCSSEHFRLANLNLAATT
jgi:hypothetical protein